MPGSRPTSTTLSLQQDQQWQSWEKRFVYISGTKQLCLHIRTRCSEMICNIMLNSNFYWIACWWKMTTRGDDLLKGKIHGCIFKFHSPLPQITWQPIDSEHCKCLARSENLLEAHPLIIAPSVPLPASPVYTCPAASSKPGQSTLYNL